jgi:two-component system, NarL family, nitrate/nitrite response regulator NarL
MKLLLADDDELVRESLKHFLQANCDVEVVLATDLEQALVQIRQDSSFDLVLLDYRMPGMNGVEGISRAVAEARVPVAVLSGNITSQRAAQAMEAGAKGVIPKSASPQTFINAMRFIAAGEFYLPPGLWKPLGSTEANLGVSLTAQEKRVLAGLCRGLPNKEIANEMDLALVTVKMHVRSLCKKLDVKNRTQAVIKAKNAGME